MIPIMDDTYYDMISLASHCSRYCKNKILWLYAGWWSKLAQPINISYLLESILLTRTFHYKFILMSYLLLGNCSL